MTFLRYPEATKILNLRLEYETELAIFIDVLDEHIRSSGCSYVEFTYWLRVAAHDEALETEILSKLAYLWPTQAEEHEGVNIPVRCRQPMP